MIDHPGDVRASVTLYALQICSHCKDVKKWLQQRGTRFEVIYVDMLVGEERNETMRTLKGLNPSESEYSPNLQVLIRSFPHIQNTSNRL